MGGKCPLLFCLGIGIANPVRGSMNSSTSGSFSALSYIFSAPSSLAFGGKFLNQSVWSSGSFTFISTSLGTR